MYVPGHVIYGMKSMENEAFHVETRSRYHRTIRNHETSARRNPMTEETPSMVLAGCIGRR